MEHTPPAHLVNGVSTTISGRAFHQALAIDLANGVTEAPNQVFELFPLPAYVRWHFPPRMLCIRGNRRFGKSRLLPLADISPWLVGTDKLENEIVVPVLQDFAGRTVSTRRLAAQGNLSAVVLKFASHLVSQLSAPRREHVRRAGIFSDPAVRDSSLRREPSLLRHLGPQSLIGAPRRLSSASARWLSGAFANRCGSRSCLRTRPPKTTAPFGQRRQANNLSISFALNPEAGCLSLVVSTSRRLREIPRRTRPQPISEGRIG